MAAHKTYSLAQLRALEQHFNNCFLKPLLNEAYIMNKSQNGAAKKEPKKTMAQLKQDIEILQAKLEVAEKSAVTWMRTAEERQKNGARVAEESLTAAMRLKNIDLMCHTYLQTAHPTQYDSMAERDKRMNMFSGGDGYREIRAHPNNSVTRFINEILSITSHPKELSQHIEP